MDGVSTGPLAMKGRGDMSVPVKHLPWWLPENAPDGVHCDRNGCTRPAKVLVSFGWYKGGYEACLLHGAWWQSRMGRSLKRATVKPR